MSGRGPSTVARPSLGRPAPDITLRDPGGEGWRLGDQLGRNVILIFHRHIH
ncbi:MAG: hypothetical protein ACR2QK_14995 [Acidimicrobiales bacterium]